MKALRHLPTLILFALAMGALYWYIQFSRASYDLCPWLIAFLTLSWGCPWMTSWFVLRRFNFPMSLRGLLSATATAPAGTLLFLALGWPLAETLTTYFREVRGHPEPGYMYHNFSGMGDGRGFYFYGETLQTALLSSFFVIFSSFILALMAALPEWIGNWILGNHDPSDDD